MLLGGHLKGGWVRTTPSHGWDHNLNVLNDETSEIERDLCAFGPIRGGTGGCSYLIALISIYYCNFSCELLAGDCFMCRSHDRP